MLVARGRRSTMCLKWGCICGWNKGMYIHMGVRQALRRRFEGVDAGRDRPTTCHLSDGLNGGGRSQRRVNCYLHSLVMLYRQLWYHLDRPNLLESTTTFQPAPSSHPCLRPSSAPPQIHLSLQADHRHIPLYASCHSPGLVPRTSPRVICVYLYM